MTVWLTIVILAWISLGLIANLVGNAKRNGKDTASLVLGIVFSLIVHGFLAFSVLYLATH